MCFVFKTSLFRIKVISKSQGHIWTATVCSYVQNERLYSAATLEWEFTEHDTELCHRDLCGYKCFALMLWTSPKYLTLYPLAILIVVCGGMNYKIYTDK